MLEKLQNASCASYHVDTLAMSVRAINNVLEDGVPASRNYTN